MKKLLYKLKRYLSLDGFSVAPVYIQIAILILISLTIVSVYSLYYGSFSESYFTFMDPTNIPDKNILVVLIEILTGLIIASFVISILSSALENFILEIKKGSLPFKHSNHIVFFNVNEKIFHILSELNEKFIDLDKIQEVIIILKTPEEVEEFLNNINFNEYPYLSIFVKYGNHLENETFDKFNLKNSKSITLLKTEEDFEADNELLKIYAALLESDIDFNRVNLVIEGNSTFNIDEIYNKLKKVKNFYNISYIDTKKFLAKLLTRTMIDVTYYKIYEEIFSFDGYELYIKTAKELKLNNITYKDAYLKFKDAILIGLKQNNKIILNEPTTIINSDDEVILIAQNEKNIYISENKISVSPINIPQPSEMVYKKVCMLGDNLKIDNILEFLDEKGKKDFKNFKFDSFEKYLDKNFIQHLKDDNFEAIIINLREEETIRYILYIMTLFNKNDEFVKNTISIVTNPENAKIIEKITGNNNIILSQRLSAKFISQLIFETELIDIIYELVSVEGSEFNIIENNFKNLSIEELKLQLLHNEITFIGLKENDEVIINGNNLQNATHILVLAKGEI